MTRIKMTQTTMNRTRLAITFILLLAAGEVSTIDQAFARGGGSNFMNSPGYQRALQESRERRSQQPYVQPPSVYPGKKWRKRGRRY